MVTSKMGDKDKSLENVSNWRKTCPRFREKGQNIKAERDSWMPVEMK